MTSEEMISRLKTIVGNDEAYRSRAADLKWIAVDLKSISEYAEFVILTVEFLTFPKGYVEKNFLDAYVRTILSFMAAMEEWEYDFWKPDSQFSLKKIFENEENHGFYEVYNSVEYPEFKSLTEEKLLAEFMTFAEKVKLEENEINIFKEAVHGAETVLIGYDKYWSPICISVKNDTVVFFNGMNYD